MRIFDTADLTQVTRLNPDEASWVYNGLDCCVTLEVRDRLVADLAKEPPNVQETYATAMRKLAPVNYMSITGLRINKPARDYAITEYRKDLATLQRRFDRICEEVLGWRINWRSPVQLKQLFYTNLGLKVIRKRDSKGNFSPTVNADALERFSYNPFAAVFANYILAMREVGKKISFLETEADADGRMRSSLNIAGTDTGRFSSSFSAFGTGSNLQNIENRLRAVFIPDDGYIFVNVDLGQADSRNMGARIWQTFYESHGPDAAGAYLDACESGDLHTTVCRMTWPGLGWPSDQALWKDFCDSVMLYGDDSFRQGAKRLGHGTNYFGTPPTMAMHTKTPVNVIQDFQQGYFRAFPLIGRYDKDLTWDDRDLTKQNWHAWVYKQLRETGELTTLFGRRRQFFDRYKDPNTLRAAIAYEPQSCTGEELDRGWLQLWAGMPEARLQLPVHDSILFQLPFEGLHELLPRALQLLRVEIELIGGRIFHVPLDAKVGWNWADSKKDKKTGLWQNENGLRPWTGREERQPPQRKTRLVHFLK